MFLKQSTAVTIVLGPFVDSVDGVSAETGLTISQADVRLSKNGGSFAQKNNATSCTHLENGYYDCPLSTTDTNTLGHLRTAVAESGALPVWRDFLVVPAEVYDALVAGTDNLTADLTTAALNGVNSQVDTALVDIGLDHLLAATVAGADVLDNSIVARLVSKSATADWDSYSHTTDSHEAIRDALPASADPWTTALPGAYTSGQAGYIVGTRIDQKISSVSGNNPGAGAIEVIYTLTDGGGTPIADADVWATSDVAGATVLASGRTDQNGRVTFYLNAGTVYYWRQKSGVNFTNPDVEMIP